MIPTKLGAVVFGGVGQVPPAARLALPSNRELDERLKNFFSVEDKFSGAFECGIYSKQEQEDIDYFNETYKIMKHPSPSKYQLSRRYDFWSDVTQKNQFEISLHRLKEGFLKKNIASTLQRFHSLDRRLKTTRKF